MPPDPAPASADHAPTLPAPPDRGERRGRLAPLLICGAQKTADDGAIGSGAEEKGVMRHAANVRYAGFWGMSGLISDIVESTRLMAF